MTLPASTHYSTSTRSPPQPTSEMETRLLKSTRPIQVKNQDSVEEIIYNGTRGLLLNRDEIRNWKPPPAAPQTVVARTPNAAAAAAAAAVATTTQSTSMSWSSEYSTATATTSSHHHHVPIFKYPINTDDSPQLITKPTDMTVEYTQDVFVRYLRPITPPDRRPGEIVIQEMPAAQVPAPAPPIIIRQQPPRPRTPEPLVIREQPPPPPPALARKLITISSTHSLRPPPPRKVIIERLPALPPKPRVVLVERWLPYERQKRRVIFQRPSQAEPVVKKPKNLIIQWESPRVEVRKKVTYLGIVRANPADYAKKFENNLTPAHSMPDEIRAVPNPNGLVLAAESSAAAESPLVPELYGDVNALIDIDLEGEGLGEYRAQINELNSSHVREYLSPNADGSFSLSPQNVNNHNQHNHQQQPTVHHIVAAQSPLQSPMTSAMIEARNIHRIVRTN